MAKAEGLNHVQPETQGPQAPLPSAHHSQRKVNFCLLQHSTACLQLQRRTQPTMAIPTSRIMRPSLPSAPCDTALSLFASSIQCTRRAPLARFSTSPSLLKGPGRGDNNKNRGVSGVRHTGIRARQTLSVKEKDFGSQKLPTPVEPTSQIVGDPDHGLYDFFKDKKLLLTPVEESHHGMAIVVTTASSGQLG